MNYVSSIFFSSLSSRMIADVIQLSFKKNQVLSPIQIWSYLQGRRKRGEGGWGRLQSPQFLAKQLTLSQPEGQIMPTTVLRAPSNFQTLRRPWSYVKNIFVKKSSYILNKHVICYHLFFPLSDKESVFLECMSFFFTNIFNEGEIKNT